MKKVLVVIDVQKKFIKDCNAERIVPAVCEKIKKCVRDGCEVMFTLDESGGDIAIDILRQIANVKIYKKHSYGCAELILDLYESKPDIIEFVGVCTDICVIVNALGAMAFLPCAQIVVDSNCCASRPENHLAALQVMKSCNVTVI